MTFPFASSKTGTLNPKVSMLRAIWRTCFAWWVRGFFGSSLSSEIGRQVILTWQLGSRVRFSLPSLRMHSLRPASGEVFDPARHRFLRSLFWLAGLQTLNDLCYDHTRYTGWLSTISRAY